MFGGNPYKKAAPDIPGAAKLLINRKLRFNEICYLNEQELSHCYNYVVLGLACLIRNNASVNGLAVNF